ncbi:MULTISPECIES: hypothetical protein [unclassified Rhizobacter]|uniref:hypothetical protein n=1 Tax=unclassified Rhizobacter TaxID=2640088 RepID=UPI0006FAC6A3|nr:MULTISPECIES: hypothetical protein [unclassified Rhizobacter]KQU81374.1 hypothetical protein ASC88_00345 [Rhizobacter sp. Root29]KQW09274.1 hypothetical protein ASC98_24035 [Rhizobacter sp. Root1238]
MPEAGPAALEDRALQELLALDDEGRGVSLTRLAKRLGVRVSVLIRLYTQMSDARIGDAAGPGWVRLQVDDGGQWRAFATDAARRLT